MERGENGRGGLWAFEAAVRVGELHRAAAKRNPAQPGVASRLRLLEEGLGTPVFRHHSRAATLTTAGRRLLPNVVPVRQCRDDGLGLVYGSPSIRARSTRQAKFCPCNQLNLL